MSWKAFIAAGVGPWSKKVLASLGIGMVTYVGFAAIQGTIESAITDSLSGIGADAYQIIAMAGIVDALGIWIGALATVAAFHAVGKLGVLGGAS